MTNDLVLAPRTELKIDRLSDMQRRRIRVALVAGLAMLAAPPASAQVCDGASVVCAIGDTGPGGGIVFYDAGAPQPWGRYLEAAPTGWSRPGAPTQVKVVMGRRGATVSWQPPADATGPLRYVVTTEPSSKGCRTTKKACTVSGLAPGRRYTFSVLAVTDVGRGEPAAAVQAMVPARPQPTPSDKPTPVYRSGRHSRGTEAQTLKAPWCPFDRVGSLGNLVTLEDIGTGIRNTDMIVQTCGSESAAGKAAGYRGGARSDWFLPSLGELVELWRRKSVVGGFPGGLFWSSSQVSKLSTDAWSQDFDDGGLYAHDRESDALVWPIRAF